MVTHPLPWEPVPVLDSPLGDEVFPNLQSKPPLVQFEPISSCSIACPLQEETDTHLAMTSFQVIAESEKVSPDSSLLQDKRPSFLIHSSQDLCSTSLCNHSDSPYLSTWMEDFSRGLPWFSPSSRVCGDTFVVRGKCSSFKLGCDAAGNPEGHVL